MKQKKTPKRKDLQSNTINISSSETSSEGDKKTWQEFAIEEFDLFYYPGNENGEQDHANVLELPEAQIEDVIDDPRGPGFEPEKHKKRSAFWKIFFGIFIVASISVGVTLFITNVAQGKSEKSKSELEDMIKKKQPKVESENRSEKLDKKEVSSKDFIDDTDKENKTLNHKELSEVTPKDFRKENKPLVEHNQPFLKKLFGILSGIKRKPIIVATSMVVIGLFTFLLQKYFVRPDYSALKQKLGDYQGHYKILNKTPNQPFSNFLSSSKLLDVNLLKERTTARSPNLPFFKFSLEQIVKKK